MTTMEDTQWTDHPIVSLDSHHAPIEFVIPPQTENYTDLSHSYLYLRCRILKAVVGNDLEADKKVASVNSFFHSMFSCIDLYLNSNRLVTSNMDTYPYRACLENLFLFGSDKKQKQLKTGEILVSRCNWKIVDWNADEIQARKATVAQSKHLELMGRSHLDLVIQKKYLTNGIEIRLRLIELPLSFVSWLEKVVAIPRSCKLKWLKSRSE